jgi:hypothetical protein
MAYCPFRELYPVVQELSGQFNGSYDVLVFIENPQDSEHGSIHYTIP